MEWVREQPRFTKEAVMGFARKADPGIVAYARAHGSVVVTNDVAAPDWKSNVKIPDVCGAMGVSCISLLELLRELGDVYMRTA